MSRPIPEEDWKYLRSVEPELLSELCGRTNRTAATILQAESKSEHEKYLKLYKHINTSDKIVADCFNDWPRSDIWLKLLLLRKHRILTDEHIAKLSDETRLLFNRFASMARE